MAKSTIPGEQRSVDGMSTYPGRQLATVIDWDSLHREFITNDTHPALSTWLREVKKWPESKIRAGNTFDHTVGWGEQRAAFQRQKTEQALNAQKQIQDELRPQLLESKLAILKNITKSIKSWHSMPAADKKLAYEIIKLELGEPLNVKPSDTDDPIIQEALEEIRNVVSARTEDAGASTSELQPAEA